MTQQKQQLHLRNRNREQYDLSALTSELPQLSTFITRSKAGKATIDFANPTAVKLLNKAILKHYYKIQFWEFPDKNLCPAVPGRADYLHHIADLLGRSNEGNIPKGEQITGVDVGVGASCIYPLIGATDYNWNFIGADIDAKSIQVAQQIVEANPQFHGKITCKVQPNKHRFFDGIINKKDKVDFTICNPPFHASAKDATQSTQRKVRNLKGRKTDEVTRNFSGIHNELIYEGGEQEFIKKMIIESQQFSMNCFWFTTLVSKSSNLKVIYKTLEKVKATAVETISVGTANKSSRIVAWTFLPKTLQKQWASVRWN